ncbi:MAG TPA: hypothetical protein VFK04_13430 [Gemmatimonadaceae bacterium]|nr:hypothetical protein [Gemmatimonadaceae bacterium]
MDRTARLRRQLAAPRRFYSICTALMLASSIACAGERSHGAEAGAGDSSTPSAPVDTGGESAQQPREGAEDTSAESGDPAMGVPGALALLKHYFDEINSHEFHDAYHLWSDDGAASGLTLEEFARGYDRTRYTTFVTGQPGRIEGAAGSRYITIPITIDAMTIDGVHQHYVGSIVLRRVVVPGAASEERSWRIYSAAIQEVQ